MQWNNGWFIHRYAKFGTFNRVVWIYIKEERAKGSQSNLGRVKITQTWNPFLVSKVSLITKTPLEIKQRNERKKGGKKKIKISKSIEHNLTASYDALRFKLDGIKGEIVGAHPLESICETVKTLIFLLKLGHVLRAQIKGLEFFSGDAGRHVPPAPPLYRVLL